MIPCHRRIGLVNWIGLWTHTAKEVRRFFKISLQTLLAPMVTSLLFLAVFALALGRTGTQIGGVDFTAFLAPGLIMMAVMQNAFTNSSSSVLIAKVQGNIVDVLMPPLSPGELAIGYVLGGMARGVAVGIVVAAALAPFAALRFADGGLIVFHLAAAALMLSTIGVITGIWSEKFDHLSTISNFVILPLSFLSGTFYSIGRLPAPWDQIALYNPFFYMIDGFRYGFIGRADGSLTVGVIVMVATNAVLLAACHRLFATGYRLKS